MKNIVESLLVLVISILIMMLCWYALYQGFNGNDLYGYNALAIGAVSFVVVIIIVSAYTNVIRKKEIEKEIVKKEKLEREITNKKSIDSFWEETETYWER